MAEANRIFYPFHAVLIGDNVMKGVQSVNMDTTFNLDPIFQLGQLEVYELIENQPDIEMTVEKVLDGRPLLFATHASGSSDASLLSRTNEQEDIHLLLYQDEGEESEGSPLAQVTCSGMFVESITYNFPVEGPATESITFVGNDKVWGVTKSIAANTFGDDEPEDNVQRREHVVMGTSQSKWPKLIPGIDSDGFNPAVGDTFAAHIQDVSITVNLNREDLFELGKRRQYFRFASFPVEVETTINVTTSGATPGDQVDAISDQENVSDEEIVVNLSDGSVFDLGTRNKLASVTQSGGDTEGGVVEIAYQFTNFNTLTVTDPTAA